MKNERYWIFHGDVFDSSLQMSSRLAKAWREGAMIFLLRINSFDQSMAKKIWETANVFFSKNQKERIKRAIKFVNNFENLAVKLAAEQHYDFVDLRSYSSADHQNNGQVGEKQVTYMNSGDWVENLTALEYEFGRWSLYKYDEMDYQIHQS